MCAFKLLREAAISAHRFKLDEETMLQAVENLSDEDVDRLWRVYHGRFEADKPIIHRIVRFASGDWTLVLRKILERSIALGISPDSVDEDGNTLMHHAAVNREGGFQFIVSLEECGVEGCNNDGETPVMWASRDNQTLSALMALAKRGASLTYVPPNTCPRACCKGVQPSSAMCVSIEYESFHCFRYHYRQAKGVIPEDCLKALEECENEDILKLAVNLKRVRTEAEAAASSSQASSSSSKKQRK